MLELWVPKITNWQQRQTTRIQSIKYVYKVERVKVDICSYMYVLICQVCCP